MYLESGCLSFPCLEEEEEEEEEEGDDGLSDVSKFDREIVLVVMFCFVLFCFGVVCRNERMGKTGANF